MKTRTLPLAVLTLLVSACGGGDAGDSASEGAAMASADADRAAIAQVSADWQTHYNMGHPDMVADFHAEDGWYLPAQGGMHEGRAELIAWMKGSTDAGAQVGLMPHETMVMGDMAVGIGMYSIEVTRDGQAAEYDGSYLNVMSKASGEWKIQGGISNLSAEPPAGYPFFEDSDAPAADEGTMGEVVDAYMTHWNLGHADMVADIYTEDAMVAFANSPMVQGRDEVASRLAERMAAGPTDIEIHDVGTMELGDGWALDGGYYMILPKGGGDPLQAGAYLALNRRAEDGSWKIHWHVSNGRVMQ
ncbi:MAG: YybH family protein [Planctomycetota bacterium]|jgi:uncharacterized protein (TIGR02246 family)